MSTICAYTIHYHHETKAMSADITTLQDLALFDLDRLGYWYLADEAQACWETGQPYPLIMDYATDLPRYILAEINLINASI